MSVTARSYRRFPQLCRFAVASGSPNDGHHHCPRRQRACQLSQAAVVALASHKGHKAFETRWHMTGARLRTYLAHDNDALPWNRQTALKKGTRARYVPIWATLTTQATFECDKPSPLEQYPGAMQTTPLWVPIAVAGIGVRGTIIAGIAGVLITQRRSGRRDDKTWGREREREPERWERKDIARGFRAPSPSCKLRTLSTSL